MFQFCFVKFAGALVKCITEAADVYCKESNSAGHAKIWVCQNMLTDYPRVWTEVTDLCR